MTLYLFGCIACFALGYWIGRTRSRDRLPREVYDMDGRRLL